MTAYKLRTGVAAAAVALLALAGCGDDDDDDNGGAQPAAEGTDDVARWCDASLAIELLPFPDLDFETATPEEIGAAFKEFIAEEMRPLLDEAEAVLPDELRQPAGTVLAALDEVEATGDPSALDNPEVDEASAEMHAFDLENCGWEPVSLTAADYRFDGSLPTSAGVTSFDLTNEGDEFHVAILVRKKDNVTGSAEAAFAAAESEEEFAESFDLVGEESIPSGSSDYGVVDLTAGEYVLFCPVPVGSTGETEGDGPPHFTQGMIETFTIE